MQINGAGHAFMFQYPDKFSKVIQTFLTTTTSCWWKDRSTKAYHAVNYMLYVATSSMATIFNAPIKIIVTESKQPYFDSRLRYFIYVSFHKSRGTTTPRSTVPLRSLCYNRWEYRTGNWSRRNLRLLMIAFI